MSKKTKEVENTEFIEQPIEEQKPVDSGLNEINDLLSSYKEKIEVVPESESIAPPKKRGRKPKNSEIEPEQNIEVNSLISGSFLILMIDLLIPAAISGINNSFSKVKVKTSDLQLTDSQKKELIPLADEAAKKLALKADPLIVFITSLVGIYGINLMALKAQNEK